MEVIVFDVRYHSLVEHILIVLLASVSGIGDDLAAVLSVFFMERFQKVDQRCGVRRSLEDTVVSDKLIFCGYLHVVSRFELPIEHGILLHAHERGIGIALRIGVAIAHRSDMPLVLFHFRQRLGFYVSDDSALLRGEIFLFHPLLDTLYAGRELLGRERRFRIGLLQLVADNLFDLSQYGISLLPQPLVVFFHRTPPHETVFIGCRFDLRAVDILYLERYESLLVEQFYDLTKQIIEDALQPVSPEIIDRPEVRFRTARKPHVVDVLRKLLTNTA